MYSFSSFRPFQVLVAQGFDLSNQRLVYSTNELDVCDL
jgi:hypothetical protein